MKVASRKRTKKANEQNIYAFLPSPEQRVGRAAKVAKVAKVAREAREEELLLLPLPDHDNETYQNLL